MVPLFTLASMLLMYFCYSSEKKVQAVREKTKLNEAIVTGKGEICGQQAVIGVCDARFLMSSMGHVVGGKDHPHGGESHQGAPACDHICLFRRSQNAGGMCVSDADGQDQRRPGPVLPKGGCCSSLC